MYWQPNNNQSDPGYPTAQPPGLPQQTQQQQPPYQQNFPSGFQQTNQAPYSPGGFPQATPYPQTTGFQQAPALPYPTGFQQAPAVPYPTGFQQTTQSPFGGQGYPQQQQYPPQQQQYPPQQQQQFSSQQQQYPPQQYPGAFPQQQAQPSYPAGYPNQNTPSVGAYPTLGQPNATTGYLPAGIPQYPASPIQIHSASASQNASAPAGSHFGVSGATNYTGTTQQTTNTNMQHYQDTPTVRASNADPLADAQILRKAMKGFGTDEAAIINVLTKRTNAERLRIAQAFKQSFGKDLTSDLKSELGGRLEEVVLAMMIPLPDYMAQVLHKAMAGIGTKEKVLIDVLCTATNQEVQWINASYTRQFRTTIEKDLAGDTSGHFRRLLVSMNTGGRFEGGHADQATAVQDAQALQQAGVKKWGTDESTFNAILATRSWTQLRLMFQEYEKLTGHSFEKAVLGEFSGDVETGMLAVVKCAKNRAAYFAERLHESFAGFGTKDDDLIFIVVTRSEVDLESIKQEYQRMYNKSLAADISGDTSGDYKKILLALVA